MRNMFFAILVLVAFFAVGKAIAGYDYSQLNLHNETAETASALDSNCLIPVMDLDADDDGTADNLDSNSSGDADFVTCTDVAGLGSGATKAEIDAAADISAAFEDVTAANTLTTAECGKAMTLNSATEFATTLPAPTAGCKFDFYIKAAPSGAAYTIVTNGGADIIVIGVNELEVDTTNDGPYDVNADTVTFADGVAVEGDFVKCNSDGTKWYCHGQTNADGGITTSTT